MGESHLILMAAHTDGYIAITVIFTRVVHLSSSHTPYKTGVRLLFKAEINLLFKMQ